MADREMPGVAEQRAAGGAAFAARFGENVRAVEACMNTVLLERRASIRSLWVTTIAGQNMVLLGEPGTAKSMVLRELAKTITVAGKPVDKFIYLMTAFTTPEEVFGPFKIDPEAFREGTYERNLFGRLAAVRLALLDEVFRANSAISNALLGVLSDRKYQNGIHEIDVPLLALIGAANNLPEGADLAAFSDRFPKKSVVRKLSREGLTAHLTRLAAGWKLPEEAGATVELEQLMTARSLLPEVRVPAHVIAALVGTSMELDARGIFRSDRGTTWALDLLRANALIEGRMEVTENDLVDALEDAFWQKESDIPVVAQILAKCVGEEVGQARTIYDNLQLIYTKWQAEHKTLRGVEGTMATVAAKTEYEEQSRRFKELKDQLNGRGRSTEQLERLRGKLTEQYFAICDVMVASSFAE